MDAWTLGPKRVLLVAGGAFVLGMEAVLISIGVAEGRSPLDVLVKNGLVCLAVVLASGSIIFSGRKPGPQMTDQGSAAGPGS